MALNTNDVLDLTKENIQPLRHGRKAAQLKTALQAQIDPDTQHQILKQREHYEYMIRMYEGDDPLNPYYLYVVWLEQSFPKMGRESNLISVIEDAIIKFKDCDKYKQDPRFVKLMIKYINVQPNPLELYQEVYGRGLGTMCSLLYKAWAEELDKHKDFKRADQVFQLGISCRAQPLQELEDAHIQFQLSIARRMLEGNMNDVNEEPSRHVLSKLPTSKVKTSRCSKDPAGVFRCNSNKSDSRIGFNSAVTKFKVFEESENDGGIREFKSRYDKLPKGSISDRENLMKASKWCGQKQKQAFKPSTPATPSFPVHEDPDAGCKTKMSVLRPRALKLKREDFNCPVAVFEPPDPTKVPMYPKQQVYVGGRDVQLEEIRAAYYWKRMKELETGNHAAQLYVDMDVSEEPVNLTKSSNSSIDQRSDQFAQNSNQPCIQVARKVNSDSETSLPNTVSTATNSFTLEPSALPTFIKPILPKPIIESQPFAAVSRRSDAFMSRTSLYNRKSEYMDVISSVDFQDERDLNTGTNFERTENPQEKYSDEMPTSKFGNLEKYDKNAAAHVDFSKDDLHDFRFSDRNNVSAFHHSPSTSITINTRAAMNVIQKMWESPLAPQVPRGQVNDDDFVESVFKMPKVHMSKTACSSPFQDQENEANVSTKSFGPFDVFTDDSMSHCRTKNSNAVPFPNYAGLSVENYVAANSAPTKSNKLPFPVFSEKDGRENIDEFFDIPFTKPKITTECVPLDEDLARPMGTLRMNEGEPCTPLPLIVPVNLQDTPLEPENKENQPPKDYFTPSERRPLSGILTPAIGVPVRELHSDDSDDDNWQMHGRDNDFDESCNTKAFAIKLPSSTPSSRPEFSRAPRRSSLYNGSYISEEVAQTNNVNLVTSVAATSQVANSKNTANLSLILENSKEQGSNSSGNSANVVSRNIV